MLYSISYAGEMKEGADLEQIKLKFIEFFNVPEDQIKHLFSGQLITVEKNLTQNRALLHILELDNVGAIAYIDAMLDESLPLGVRRNRRNDFMLERRQGDRRLQSRRRKTDS